MFWNLLDSTEPTKQGGLPTWIFLVAIIGIFVVFMIISNQRNKKAQKEAQEKLDAIHAGSKVKTIGGICGTVISVDKNKNTFILETGDSKKCRIEFDKQAVYQTDAVPEKNEPVKTEKKEKTEEPAPAPVEETAEKDPFEAVEEKTEE